MANASVSINPPIGSQSVAESVVGVISFPQGVEAIQDGIQINAFVAFGGTAATTSCALKVRQLPYTAWEAAGFNVPTGATTINGAALTTYVNVGPTAGIVTSTPASTPFVATLSQTDFSPISQQGAGVQAVYVVTATLVGAAQATTYVQLSLLSNGVN